MTVSFGSGQTNGAPLLITAITLGTAQTLHTCPVGAATPNVIGLYAFNSAEVGVVVSISLYDSAAALIRTFTKAVGAKAFLQPLLDEGTDEADLILNGTIGVKVHADTASVISIVARVDNQVGTSAAAAENIPSGLIASVQNANRFGTFVNGGVGDATEVNGNIMMRAAGTLRNLAAKASAAVGAGAIVTVAVRINAVSSALSLTFANADGTAVKTDSDSVAVAAGDLVTFLVGCDNGGVPAAGMQAAVDFVPA